MKEATISLQISLLLHAQPKLIVKPTGHHMMIVTIWTRGLSLLAESDVGGRHRLYSVALGSDTYFTKWSLTVPESQRLTCENWCNYTWQSPLAEDYNPEQLSFTWWPHPIMGDHGIWCLVLWSLPASPWPHLQPQFRQGIWLYSISRICRWWCSLLQRFFFW